jgi:hypothetical protein
MSKYKPPKWNGYINRQRALTTLNIQGKAKRVAVNIAENLAVLYFFY